MNAVDVIKRLHQHRAWSNANLLSTARELTDEQLHSIYPIGQGSIWKSLTHLFGAEHVWLGALSGDDAAVAPGDVAGQLPGNQLGEGRMTRLDDLVARWQDLDRRWDSYLATLTPESLDETVYRKVSTTGVRFGTRCSDILLHVCTHAHYTTAQIVNMLRQTGLEKLPETMLISLARLESKC
ncbi:DinB family protein [Schlesneria sp. DSM 10557]|uniref:DinB family protein n=1 Tax=Schlesneria sp. DSM 10557 TaxID=3044399 RepID=UPI0035A0DFCF